MSNLSLLHLDFFYKHLSPHTDVVSCFVNNTHLPYRDAVRDAVTNAVTQDGWWMSLYHAIQATCPLPHEVNTFVPLLQKVLSVTVAPPDTAQSVVEFYNDLIAQHMQKGNIASKETTENSRLTSLTPAEVEFIADLIKIYGTGQLSTGSDVLESLKIVHAEGDTGRVTVLNAQPLEQLLIHLYNSVTGNAIRFFAYENGKLVGKQ